MRLLPLLLLTTVGFAQPRERQFSFEYRAQIPATVPGHQFHLWIPLPHDDANQQINNLNIEASGPYKIAKDQLGNHILIPFR